MTSTASSNPKILVACRDLMFISRIQAEARAGGACVELIADANDLAAALHGEVRPQCFLVDLDLGQPALEMIAHARAAAAGLRIIAFGPHVDRDRLNAARASGADTVLPRSRFVNDLPQIMRTHA